MNPSRNNSISNNNSNSDGGNNLNTHGFRFSTTKRNSGSSIGSMIRSSRNNSNSSARINLPNPSSSASSYQRIIPTGASAMTTGNSTGNKEVIVDKLHQALNASRRDRDELHRKKELALERARLANEETKALSLAVQQLQSKVNQLRLSLSNIKERLPSKEELVRKLNHEVQFQHAELLAAQQKNSRVKKETIQNDNIRQCHFAAACEEVRKRRDKVNAIEKQLQKFQPVSLATQIEGLNRELKDHNLASVDPRFEKYVWDRIPKLLEDQTSIILEQVKESCRKRAKAEHIASGYETFLDTSAKMTALGSAQTRDEQMPSVEENVALATTLAGPIGSDLQTNSTNNLDAAINTACDHTNSQN